MLYPTIADVGILEIVWVVLISKEKNTGVLNAEKNSSMKSEIE
jgi:hypothetical protein